MQSSFRKIRFITCLAVLVLMAGQGSLQAADLGSRANIFMYAKPMPIASLVLRSSSGQTVSLGDLKGRVVLLRFSSINCPACRQEEPLLEELKQKFGPAGLEILGVNLVDSPQAIAQHALTNRTSFPILFDGGGGFSLKAVEFGGKRTAFVLNPGKEAILEVPGFPTTYILDCSGAAVGYSVGAARWDDGAAVALIQGLMGDRKACSSRSSNAGPRMYSGR
jgi:thiol-disulfide isomerase/thioredoxin